MARATIVPQFVASEESVRDALAQAEGEVAFNGQDLTDVGELTVDGGVSVKGDLVFPDPTVSFRLGGNTIARRRWGVFEEDLVLTGAFTDTEIVIPANSLVFWVTARVIEDVVTSSATNTFNYGIAGALTRYGSGITGAANSSHPGPDSSGAPRFYTAETAIRFDAPGAETFSSGTVRVTILYEEAFIPGGE